MTRLWQWLGALLLGIMGALVYYAITRPSDVILAPKQKLIFQLQWTPQAQFIGFYVAKAKHYYAEEGFDVELLHGGPDINPIRSVVYSQAQIGLATADQVLLWADKNDTREHDLVAFGTVFNQSLACFMSKTSTHIIAPNDLRKKRIGVFPSYDTQHLLEALLKNHNIPESEVTIVEFPTLVQFDEGSLDVYPAYVINEPLWAKQRGIEVDILKPDQFGIRFYSDTFIARKDYCDRNTDNIKAFLRASARGWRYAQSSPEEAMELMYEVVGGSLGEGQPRQLQAAMAAEAVKYVGAGKYSLPFVMEPSRWADMERALRGLHKLQKRDLVRRLCDFDIAEAALRSGQP